MLAGLIFLLIGATGKASARTSRTSTAQYESATGKASVWNLQSQAVRYERASGKASVRVSQTQPVSNGGGNTRAPRATIWAVGDVMLARWVGRRIEREGPVAPFKAFHNRFILGPHDLLIGNLECAITDKPVTAFKPIDLRANPKVVPGLTYAGFSILSLANNHAGDCGPEGRADTAARLNRVGIASLQPDATPIYKTVNGLRLAFMGLTDLPGYPLAADWETKLKAVRQNSDIVTVMMHWGIEQTFPEDHRQRALAQRLAADGVDVILGCHPHVLQPIKSLSGPNGRHCLVAYSLGNFVFDAKPGPESKSELVRVVVDAKGFQSFKATPLTIVRGAPR